VPDDRLAEYNAELEELLDQEVEVDIHTIGAEALAMCEEKRPGFALPPIVPFAAWFMFED
jgi:hypothetical protein